MTTNLNGGPPPTHRACAYVLVSVPARLTRVELEGTVHMKVQYESVRLCCAWPHRTVRRALMCDERLRQTRCTPIKPPDRLTSASAASLSSVHRIACDSALLRLSLTYALELPATYRYQDVEPPQFVPLYRPTLMKPSHARFQLP